jgi:hypothetical protein
MTMLEALQAGISGQLAVLDDRAVTGTGQSSADVLGIAGAVVAQTLTSHLLREIVDRGARGGPLASLANQLNHDATHLQNQRAEGKIDRIDDKLIEVLERLSAIPALGAADDRPSLTARFVPSALGHVLRESPPCLDTCESLLSIYSGLLGNPPGSPTQAEDFGKSCDYLLRAILANVHPDASPLLSARDAAVIVALAAHVSYCAFLPVSTLADLISSDGHVRTCWVGYVDSIKKMSPRAWDEFTGIPKSLKPDNDTLGSLPSTGLSGSENLAVTLFLEREIHVVSPAMAHTAEHASIRTSLSEPFPRFWDIWSSALTALNTPPYAFVEQVGKRLSGVRIVAGCHLLYLSMLLREAMCFRRLIEVADDGVLSPIRVLLSSDRRLRKVQLAVSDIQPENEDETDALRLICAPESPRLLAEVRQEIDSLRQVIDQCTASLAQHYVAGREQALRLRFPRLRSTVDDPYSYIREHGLSFDPDLARLVMDVDGVLPLLIRPLYGNAPAVGIRELLQNALDAVSAREAMGRGTIRYGATGHQPESGVTITITDGTGPAPETAILQVPPPAGWEQWLEVSDSGVGMTSEVIREHFMTVGGSFDPVTDPLSLLSHSPRVTPRSGRFGVGVLASFLLGTEIQVITRHMGANENEALSMQLTQYVGEAELYYCSAPIGTTVRVRLDAKTADELAGNPSAWDWFQYTVPSVTRARIHEGSISYFRSGIPPLDPTSPSDLWRKLTISPYGDVFWTPSDVSYMSQILVNGIRVTSLHRNFAKNVMEPVEQLKQPIISIVDRAQACSLKLTRDGFVEYPESVFAAVRNDAIADHIAWLTANARDGLDLNVKWESPVWEEEQTHWGTGDGVINAVPFLVADQGIIPLHYTLLREAGVTELNLLLVRGSIVLNEEQKRVRARRPENDTDVIRATDPVETLRMLSARSKQTGYPTGIIKVDMFGGFGYHSLAAAVEETFRFARFAHPTATAQIVTIERGTPYIERYNGKAIFTWDDALALADPRETRNPVVEKYVTSMTDRGNAKRVDKKFGDLVEAGYYGILHIWLGDQEEPEEDNFIKIWRPYKLPSLLPFELDVNSIKSPLAADLKKRATRMSAY